MNNNNNSYIISDFYCTKCGNKGIALPRKTKKIREPGHLKKLYCPYCREVVNHVECRGIGKYDYDDFLIEFNNGNFDAEGNRKIPWRQFEASINSLIPIPMGKPVGLR